jgi:hypothetical protein
MASGFEKEFSLMDVNMNFNKTQVPNFKFQAPRESNNFLRFFYQLKLGDLKNCEYLVKESTELKSILTSIINKL